MKKILLLLAMFLSFATQAQDFTPTNWVSDLGNFYTPEQEANLNSTISAYEKKTSIEIGVITIDSLGDNSIEQFALDQFNRLGIGKKGADNGILIVFSMKDRKSRIEVGNGMEAFFTDGDSHDALQVVKPHFRAGDYATGTSECINFITNKLGNQAFANKVAWLKEKQAKEAKQKAASIAAFKSGVIKFLLIASFFGALVFIYFLDKKRREKIAAEKERLRLEAEREATRIRKENERVERVKQNISQTEKYLKSVSVNRPTTENSKLLSSSFSSVTSFISSMVIEKGNMDNDQYIEALLRIKGTLDSKIEAYNELNSEYRTNISKYSDLDSLVNEAHSYNKKAISSLEKIKQYGYNKDYKDLTSSIDSLLESKTAIEALFLTDVDKAISDAKKFKDSIDYLKSKSSDVTAYLNEIESAKSKVNSAESLFTSGLSKLDRYKKWMKPGEVDKVKSEFEKFKTKSNSSNDFLNLILIFAGVMTAVSALESTLSGRKSKEEEEERAEQRRLAAIAAAAEAERRRKKRQEEEEDDRRRRNSYSSSYGSSWSSSSSSSSDSGSSWGGFDGGSSSGGGSSDSW
jgi:uncharacterized membrane protein YgcG